MQLNIYVDSAKESRNRKDSKHNTLCCLINE